MSVGEAAAAALEAPSPVLCCPPGEDIRLSISQVLTCRTFCNKMWQTLRFTLAVVAESGAPLTTLEEVLQRPAGGRAHA